MAGPARAWAVTAAGTAVNLCLGILYGWSVWKAALVPQDKSLYGQPMTGLNEGWTYLTNAQGNWAYSVCGAVFALFMIPGGRLQDRYGAKIGATLGGLFLAVGCVVAGLLKSYEGLVLGFGVLGGIGMGLGYAAATPAAVKWFHSSRRGLIVGLVVAGYGAAAVYISPLADYLITNYGLTGSFVGLGIFFAVVVVVAGLLLSPPPPGYVAPAPAHVVDGPKLVTTNFGAGQMLRTWQFYALVFLFIGSAQSGLLVIANAKSLLTDAAGKTGFFARNAWLLVTFIGVVNATGRIGTGQYSDRIGRLNAYALNGLVSAACLLAAPWVIAEKNVLFLFVVIGVMAWQYGGTLAVLPALTADYYGPKNLGLNYGLVFAGWGGAFFVPQIASVIKDATERWDGAFYLSAGLLVTAVVASRIIRKPVSVAPGE
ncbi:putative MFS-type transporter YhjX [Gemmata sp. SH-PL17]|uniref:L-lactate MFS transporter n=1 Tax=Gemmata sp. SH-PL17 TaxID=1630693 RepID=UPI00078C7B86|nr:OFA family MFS transporter [Gemmata sp. SH-PL17]AMV23243.1 putative MFS-type transporter YhjX [Gemmata sp. SH-PL17]